MTIKKKLNLKKTEGYVNIFFALPLIGDKNYVGGKLRNPIFTISLELEVFFLLKKGIHWLGQGFKIGLEDKCGKIKEI